MAISKLEIDNVLVFENTKVTLDFSDGINVLIGENGSGKSTVLKMIYAAMQSTLHNNLRKAHRIIMDCFLIDETNDDNNQSNPNKGTASLVDNNEQRFTINFRNGLLDKIHRSHLSEVPSVFIPTTEMLSHAKGFLALYEKYKLPFDRTQVDIIMNASLPETREIPSGMTSIMDKISDKIDGTVIQEDDTFYVQKKDGKKIAFSLEAEGLRKLGLIWKLIRNGLLESGSILLWDEPEANLNPELYPLVAEILLELQKNGVQIFVATHSYNFAKYLEIRREKTEQVRFINLHKDSNGLICCDEGHQMEDIQPNHIMMADNALLNEVFNM